MQDTNFDSRAVSFKRNIYGTGKGKIREAVVWRDLRDVLLPRISGQPAVLDVGGGIGQLSRKLAGVGHPVTLCDLSHEMLTQAQIEAEQAGVALQYQYIHAPLQSLSNHLDKPYEIVLFHAVMEWLSDPEAALKHLIEQHLAHDGYLSLMFFNQLGIEFHNMVGGNFDNLSKGMYRNRNSPLTPGKGFVPEQVYQCLEAAEMEIIHISGVRVFHDYMRDRRLHGTHLDDIIEAELRFSTQEPYRSLGRYMHVIAQRKQSVARGNDG